MATAVKLHVKKGDTVQVLSGKDKGKEAHSQRQKHNLTGTALKGKAPCE